MTLTRPAAARRCGALLWGVLLLLMVPLTACGGPDLRYTPAVGVTELGEDMDALSLTVVTDGEGNATLVGTLLNHGSQPDKLLGVTATSPSTGQTVTTTLPQGPVTLPVEEPVQLAERFAVRLTEPSFRLGYALDVTLSFARAGDITLKVLMYSQEGYFDDVPISPTPASTP